MFPSSCDGPHTAKEDTCGGRVAKGLMGQAARSSFLLEMVVIDDGADLGLKVVWEVVKVRVTARTGSRHAGVIQKLDNPEHIGILQTCFVCFLQTHGYCCCSVVLRYFALSPQHFYW